MEWNTETQRHSDCFVHAVDDLPASFRASGPLPDNSRKARVPVCRQHGMPPDVPPHGLAIPYYNKYIGIGMSARQCTGGKGRHVALGRYPVGCL